MHAVGQAIPGIPVDAIFVGTPVLRGSIIDVMAYNKIPAVSGVTVMEEGCRHAEPAACKKFTMCTAVNYIKGDLHERFQNVM